MEEQALLLAIGQMMDTKLTQALEPVNSRLNKIEENLANVKEDLANVKEDLASVKEDLVSVKEDLVSVKEDLDVVKETVLETRDTVNILVEKVYDAPGVDALAETVAGHDRRITYLEEKIS